MPITKHMDEVIESIYGLVDELGFKSDIVVKINPIEVEENKILYEIVLNSTLYDAVPFLKGGRIVTLFQSFVQKLPTTYEGKSVEYLFMPDKKVEPGADNIIEKKSTLEKGDRVRSLLKGNTGVIVETRPASGDSGKDVDYVVSWDEPLEGLKITEVHPTEIEKIAYDVNEVPYFVLVKETEKLPEDERKYRLELIWSPRWGIISVINGYKKTVKEIIEWCKSNDLRSYVLVIDDEKKVFKVGGRLAYKYKDYIRKLVCKGSVIDYPKKTLDPKIWNLEKDPPELRIEVEEKILTTVENKLKEKYPDIDWDKHLTEINLTGSIGTYQYRERSDIDVHIVVDKDKIDKEYGVEGFTIKELQDYVRGKEVSGWKIDGHPVNYYLQVDKKQDMLGDALYRVIERTWVIKPELPEDIKEFDPEKKYELIWVKAKEWMDKFVLGIAELQRDIKDIEELEEWLSSLSNDELEWLEKKINDKIKEVNDVLVLISEGFTQVHEERKKAYGDEPEDVLRDYIESRGKAPGNIQWKFLEKYGFVTLLANLRYITRSVKLTQEQKVEEARKLLERFNLMFEQLSGISSDESEDLEKQSSIKLAVYVSEIIKRLEEIKYKVSDLSVRLQIDQLIKEIKKSGITASFRKLSQMDQANIALLNSGVSKLGQEILKQPAAIDLLATFVAVDYLVRELIRDNSRDLYVR